MYNREDVYNSALEYFNGDELAAEVWVDKYCLKDQSGNYYENTPIDMFNRLSSEFSRIENKYPNTVDEGEIYELLKDFKYIIPGGSGLAGIGNNHLLTSLSNCFVVDSPYDSYPGIMKTEDELVSIMKRRGGVGLSIGSLRSKNMPTTSVSEKSSGVVLFSERYSRATREVAQDGRRGALMISLPVSHPDVMNFIEAKVDKKMITGANVSVMIDDKFMQAVIDDTDYELLFINEKGEARETVKAKDIWNKIIFNAWKSAEPGVLFWDTILRESPADCYSKFGFKTTSTNPCFTGDTVVAVADGRNGVTIKELADEGKDIPVYCINNEGDLCIRTMRNPRITGYTNKIYKVLLDSGDYLRCTGNHKFYLKDGSEKNVLELKNGDSLKIFSKVKDTKFSNNKIDLLSNGKCYSEHRFLYKNIIGEINGEDIHHIDNNPFNNSIDNLIKLTKGEHNSVHNKAYIGELNGNFSGISNDDLKKIFINKTKELGRRLSREEYYNLGGVSWSNYRKELNETLYGFLYEIAVECFTDENLYKYDSRVSRTYLKSIENGYETKIIEGRVHVKKICENCGSEFWKEYQSREISFCSSKCALEKVNERRWGNNNEDKESEFYNHKVVNVIEDGFEDVYNGTVDEYHNFFVGGFKSKTRGNQDKETFIATPQCGEIPLSPGDSCRLMCLNLFSYVVNPFQNDCYFDYVLFKKHSRIAQRLIDDLIDLEIEKIRDIIIKVENDNDPEELKGRELKLWNNILDRAVKGRRTGLGITAEGDMIAAMGLRYASDEAIELSVEVHKTLAIESYKSSIELAKERDSFVIWDRDLEKNNPFLGRIISELLCENGPCSYMREDTPMSDYLKYGRRNIANLTIAPTGSLSILTGTTSGIEPLFLPYYNRKKKTNIKSDKTIVDDQGDIWEEFKVIHSKFKMWYDLNWFKIDVKSFDLGFKKELSDMNDKELNEVFKKSPYYKSTSNDIDWVNKVKMQGEIQKWVDHSISVTVNLPKETEVSVVDKLYMTAYLSGCKGMTVYRDGCRDGVLSSGNKQKGELNYTDAPKRPSKLECDIYSKTALGKDFTIIVGLMEDKPFEIFAFSQIHQVDFPKEIKIGTLQKLKSGVYKLSGFKGGKEYFIDNIITLMDDNESTNTRRYSLKLRHGIDPIHITDQIDKYANITSFDKVIGRVLKNYLNGKKTKSLCPDCNSNLVMQDGCEKCLNCGYSKCG